MSRQMDRVHFYERQYLRAFDLEAEQAYHLQMRRRLNLALHLWGIVEGFNIAKGQVVPGLPDQFIVSPGMAIDGFGREIISPLAYALSDNDLHRNRITLPGEYWLSVEYQREQTTPPASGFRLCDLDDQFTRWHESLSFLITQEDPTKSLVAPGLGDPLPDDPKQKKWPVVLGKLVIGSSGGTLTLDDVKLEGHRVYVGSRTQRLLSPASTLGTTAGEPRKPIVITADAQEEKNFIVGNDFPVPIAKVSPQPNPVPPQFPTETGNVKIENDLFVKGEIYKYISVTDQWLSLKEHLRQFVPDVQLKRHSFVPTTPGAVTQPVSGTENVVITTVLNAPASKQFAVAIAGLTLKNKTNLTSWAGGIPVGNQWLLTVEPDGAPTSVGAKQWQFQVKWTIAPMSTAALAPIPIDKVEISCIAVFQP